MFERFTDNTKRAMNEARKEAQRLGHDYLDAEHLLLGLLGVPGCAALRLLQAAGCEAEAIRSRVESGLAAGKKLAGVGQLPFTPRSKKVLELSMDTAGSLRDTYIGTEHVLLGCALTFERDGKGRSAAILGADPEGLHAQLAHVQRGEAPPSGTTPSMARSSQTDPSLVGLTAHELLLRAAEACEKAKVELIHEQKFDQAARARDLSVWLRQLVDESGGKASS